MKKLLAIVLTLGVVMLTALGCGANKESATIRVGALKGPTAIGLMKLMDDASNGACDNEYTFEIAAAADELLPKIISGDLDVALVPANVAAVLYNKTEGGIQVLDINTLGVLYAVSGNSDITSVSDLKGQTIYLTGKGTTPDYVLQYLLNANGLSLADVTLEYKSEATEVAAMLKEDSSKVGILPQPFVTAACIQNEELSPVINLTAEWDKVCEATGSRLVTGVTIATKDFINAHEGAIKGFMAEHKASAEFTKANLDETAALVVANGIIEKEPVAKKAIPNCNITYIDGDEMEKALSGYLGALYELDPTTVGGTLPNEDFYY